jgi:hypothetical protein
VFRFFLSDSCVVVSRSGFCRSPLQDISLGSLRTVEGDEEEVQSEHRAPEPSEQVVSSVERALPASTSAVASTMRPSSGAPATSSVAAVEAESQPVASSALPPPAVSTAVSLAPVSSSAGQVVSAGATPSVAPVSTEGATLRPTPVVPSAVLTTSVVVTSGAPPRSPLAPVPPRTARPAASAPSFVAGRLNPSVPLVASFRDVTPRPSSPAIRGPPSLTPSGRALISEGLTDPHLKKIMRDTAFFVSWLEQNFKVDIEVSCVFG